MTASTYGGKTDRPLPPCLLFLRYKHIVLVIMMSNVVERTRPRVNSHCRENNN